MKGSSIHHRTGPQGGGGVAGGRAKHLAPYLVERADALLPGVGLEVAHHHLPDEEPRPRLPAAGVRLRRARRGLHGEEHKGWGEGVRVGGAPGRRSERGRENPPLPPTAAAAPAL